jgi:penicillin-binding protein 2
MQIYQNRVRIIIFIISFIGAVLIIRLFYLQIIEKKYKQFAQDNALQRRIIYPPRGIIYDRTGKILVCNEAVYDLMVIPSRIKSLDTNDLCEILKIRKTEFDSILKEIKHYSKYKASVFLKNLSIETYGLLQERLYEFRGFYVQPRTLRNYPLALCPHLFGYIGEVSEKDIEKSNNYYRLGDYIGISGLEQYYEKDLRGENGEKYILVDVLNVEQGSYEGGKLDKPSKAGHDLICTLNRDLQAYAEKLMQNKRGAIVAIEPATGEVLIMVSKPAYNPALMIGRDRAKNYNILLKDPNKPLFNRAITAMYPPGSSFKVVQALIGLQEGVLFPSTTYSCHQGYILPGLIIGCHKHPSPQDLHGSIVYSCNAYYCNVFRTIIDMKKFNSPQKGYINWWNDVSKFGIGSKLGIDLPNESPGILPTYKRYDKIYGKGRWKSSNILSLAIGQAEISLTPLQLANVAAIIANRGYYISPHLVRSIISDKKEKKLSFKKQIVDIDQDNYALVVNAMADVVNFGTATLAKVNGIEVCGKTGTAQNPQGKDHSIFICFAPKDNPKIAMVVIVENAGFGGTWAAPISGLLIEKYLKNAVDSNRVWQEERILKFNNDSLNKIQSNTDGE